MLQRFWHDESGAATIDWIVLTAASVGLGIAVMGTVRSGIEDLSAQIDSFLSQDLIHTSFDHHPVLNPAPTPATDPGPP